MGQEVRQFPISTVDSTSADVSTPISDGSHEIDPPLFVRRVGSKDSIETDTSTIFTKNSRSSTSTRASTPEPTKRNTLPAPIIAGTLPTDPDIYEIPRDGNGNYETGVRIRFPEAVFTQVIQPRPNKENLRTQPLLPVTIKNPLVSRLPLAPPPKIPYKSRFPPTGFSIHPTNGPIGTIHHFPILHGSPFLQHWNPHHPFPPQATEASLYNTFYNMASTLPNFASLDLQNRSPTRNPAHGKLTIVIGVWGNEAPAPGTERVRALVAGLQGLLDSRELNMIGNRVVCEVLGPRRSLEASKGLWGGGCSGLAGSAGSFQTQGGKVNVLGEEEDEWEWDEEGELGFEEWAYLPDENERRMMGEEAAAKERKNNKRR
ncbi:MAG: hypothetical protein MMC33_000773 [Icmadophila ericetorum]|nr:hypothetical protein [Icmadophila ericetorum]